MSSEVQMFTKKAEKPIEDTKKTTANAERIIGGSLHDLADLSKQRIAENIVGMIKTKRIKSVINDTDLRAIISIAEMSVDQSLVTIGGRVAKIAREVTP